jgi:hypothetical protein
MLPVNIGSPKTVTIAGDPSNVRYAQVLQGLCTATAAPNKITDDALGDLSKPARDGVCYQKISEA